jgi:hypothetical protein
MKKLAVMALLLAGAAVALAQRPQGGFGGGGFGGGGFGGNGISDRLCLVSGTKRSWRDDTSASRNVDKTGFVYGRLKYTPTPNWGGDIPWHHDYPDGDTMLPDALERLTLVRTNPEAYQIVEIDGKEIFKYPFVYMSEVGYLELRPNDAKNLKEYLDRGGFVLVDDFRGKPGQMEEMENFVYELRKLYPDRQLEQLSPDHQIFHSFFDIDPTQARPAYKMYNSSDVPSFFALKDEKGRIQMVVNFNYDASEFWQGLDVQQCSLGDSSQAVQMGINYVIYAMTH